MVTLHTDSLDIKIRAALTAWKKLDETDVKILEAISLLGPRNLALVAKHLKLPRKTVSYRVNRMLSESILFFQVNPYITNMGLKKAFVFAEATPGLEDVLMKCLRVNGFWILLYHIYGPYEGCGGVWGIPKEHVEEFLLFLHILKEVGVARSYEVIWSTCFEGIPVKSRWFSVRDGQWVFNWEEWLKEVETIEGELPYTLVEPDDWPIKVDLVDVLIIKELEKDGKASMVHISESLGIPVSTINYHFREHVLKRELIEGYQVEIYRFPFPICELLIFIFEFDSHDKMSKFALSLLDKPFVIFIGKALNMNKLVAQIYLPKWEFRKFIHALSTLIRRGVLKQYRYFIEDMYQTDRQTVSYEYFENGKWNYDFEKHREELRKIFKKTGVSTTKNHTNKKSGKINAQSF